MEEKEENSKEDFEQIEQELGEIHKHLEGKVKLQKKEKPKVDFSALNRRTSLWAILSLVFSFVPPLGLISGIIAISHINKNQSEVKGLGMAISGIVLSLLFFFFELVFLINGIAGTSGENRCVIEQPFKCSTPRIEGESLLIKFSAVLSAGTSLDDPTITIDGYPCRGLLVPGDPAPEEEWIT